MSKKKPGFDTMLHECEICRLFLPTTAALKRHTQQEHRTPAPWGGVAWRRREAQGRDTHYTRRSVVYSKRSS